MVVRINEDSLRRAGLQLYREPSTNCRTRPYQDATGAWRLPAAKRECVRDILEITNDSPGITPNQAGAWVRWAISAVGHLGLNEQAGIWLIGKKLSDIPEHDPIIATHQELVDNEIIRAAVKTAQFVVDPMNWISLIALTLGGILTAVSAYKLWGAYGEKSTPQQGAPQGGSTAEEATKQAMNFLPAKKAITIVR